MILIQDWMRALVFLPVKTVGGHKVRAFSVVERRVWSDGFTKWADYRMPLIDGKKHLRNVQYQPFREHFKRLN